MCVVSMIFDHTYDEWYRKYINPWRSQPAAPPYEPQPQPTRPKPTRPTQAEIDEFYRLLERAREYDKKNNQPDCELEEKRQKLKALADELGIKIDFPGESQGA